MSEAGTASSGWPGFIGIGQPRRPVRIWRYEDSARAQQVQNSKEPGSCRVNDYLARMRGMIVTQHDQIMHAAVIFPDSR